MSYVQRGIMRPDVKRKFAKAGKGISKATKYVVGAYKEIDERSKRRR